MAHSDILSEPEYGKHKMNNEVLRYLALCERELGLDKTSIRILDWGCGRGVNTMHLLDRGYRHVKGVDIVPNAIERGREFFAGRGYDIDHYLSALDEDGIATTLADESFDFVFSTRVFEHVRDMETVVSELERVTAPGGMGLHIYPGHHLPVEGHLKMPLVHWLPKGKLREVLITAWTAAGVEPGWTRQQHKSVRERARAYNHFSTNNTYYRHYDEVQALFENRGLTVQFVSIDHPVFTKRPFFNRALQSETTRRMANWAVLNFKTVEIVTRKLAVPVPPSADKA